MPETLTTGNIVQRTGEPLHRVLYVIASRKIQPIGRAGPVRLFSPEQAEQIAAELRRIDSLHRPPAVRAAV